MGTYVWEQGLEDNAWAQLYPTTSVTMQLPVTEESSHPTCETAS